MAKRDKSEKICKKCKQPLDPGESICPACKLNREHRNRGLLGLAWVISIFIPRLRIFGTLLVPIFMVFKFIFSFFKRNKK